MKASELGVENMPPLDLFSIDGITIKELKDAANKVERVASYAFIEGSDSYYEMTNAVASIRGMINLLSKKAVDDFESLGFFWIKRTGSPDESE